MEPITQEQARLSMDVIMKLISVFYACNLNEKNMTIDIPFIGYSIVIKVVYK